MKLNLGSGFCTLEGYQNIDLVFGHRLPGYLRAFGDGTVDVIHSEHFLEHLLLDDAITLLKECRRIIKPDGVVRISVPDLRVLVNKYLENRLTDYGGAWLPVSPAALMNEGMRAWGHQYMYDQAELERVLRLAGFTRVEFSPTPHPETLRFNFGDLYAVARYTNTT